MSEPLTDAHYKWMHRLTGIDARPGARGPSRIVHSAKEMDDDLEAHLDGGAASTPMALEPQTAKEKAEAQARRRTEEKQAKEDNAREQARLHNPEFVDGIVSRSKANRANFQIVVKGAGEAFSVYATDKISEFEKDIAADDLFGELLADAAGMIAGKLGEKIGEKLNELGGEIAKKIWGKIQKSLESEMDKGIRAKFKGPSSDDLKKALADIVAGAGAAGTAMSNAVETELEAPLTRIANQLKQSGNRLDQKDAPLLECFVSSDLDTVLESFGVPNDNSAKSLQVRTYGAMVKAFEKKLIVAKHLALGLDAGSIEEGTVDHNAQLHANDAMKARQEALDRAGMRPGAGPA